MNRVLLSVVYMLPLRTRQLYHKCALLEPYNISDVREFLIGSESD